jgi:prophage antirepressor-like protein
LAGEAAFNLTPMEGLMAGDVKVFEFEGRRVRTVPGDDGEPWFVAVDVCSVLGLGNPTQALARLDEDEKSSIRATLITDEGRAGQGAQSFTIVNEPGLYRLVLSSRKPEARRFKRWVVHEVLPTIRKTGAFVTDAAAASDPILAQAQMLIEMRLKQIAQEQRLAAIEQRIDTLPAPTTHLSVLAFANLNGIRLDNRLASVLGKHCAALTRLNGGVIGAVPDEHYGTVGNYPLPVLRQVFAAAGLIADEPLN